MWDATGWKQLERGHLKCNSVVCFSDVILAAFRYVLFLSLPLSFYIVEETTSESVGVSAQVQPVYTPSAAMKAR